MPTGYTYPVCEGKITAFPEFALSCARAFGALITMRDDPMDAPTPEVIEPSDYYENALKSAYARLSGLQKMTNGQADEAAKAAHQEALDGRAKFLREKDTEAERLNAMLGHVRKWKPPTPDHNPMKAFMIDQLTMSMPGTYVPEIPVLLDGETWRKQEIDRATEDVVQRKADRDKEIERANGRTEWLKSLRASLAE